MLVHVAVVDHRHGTNFYASATEQGLRDQLYDYVCDEWSDFCDGEPPKNKADAIEQYFEAAANVPGGKSEWVSSDTLEVVDLDQLEMRLLLARMHMALKDFYDEAKDDVPAQLKDEAEIVLRQAAEFFKEGEI